MSALIAEANPVIFAAGDGAGSCWPFASVQVNVHGGGAASIFSDSGLSVPLANPLKANPQGNVTFNVAPGDYDLVATSQQNASRTVWVNVSPAPGAGNLNVSTLESGVAFPDPIFNIVTGGTERFRFRCISVNGGATDFRILGSSAAPAILSLIAPNGTDYADYTFDGANAEIDLSTGALSLRPLAGNVQVYAPSAQAKLRCGNAGFTQALDIWHDGTNGHLAPTTGVVEISSAVKIDTLPAFVSGDHYLIVDSSGNVHKSALGPAS